MTYEKHIDEIFDSETFEESIKRRIKDSIAKYLSAERSRTIEECKAWVCKKCRVRVFCANCEFRNMEDDLKAKGGKP